MACTNCNKKTGCSCQDTAFTTIPTYQSLPNISCPSPEPCSEFTSANCIQYTGYPIVDLNINTGDRLNDIIQKLILLSTNPGCVTSTTCAAINNLTILNVTNSTITPLWDLVSTATNYQVEYKLASAGSFSTLTQVGSTITQGTITGLTPSTDYHVRVNSFCRPSLTITNGGTLYSADGIHTGVTFTGGSGTGMIATVTISGGIMISILVTDAGTGYTVSNILTPVVGSGTPAITHGAGVVAQFTIASLGSCESVTLLVKTLV